MHDHWRLRLLCDSAVQNPFQSHGRWITVPANGWNESDLLCFSNTDHDGDPCLDRQGEIFLALPIRRRSERRRSEG